MVAPTRTGLPRRVRRTRHRFVPFSPLGKGILTGTVDTSTAFARVEIHGGPYPDFLEAQTNL